MNVYDFKSIKGLQGKRRERACWVKSPHVAPRVWDGGGRGAGTWRDSLRRKRLASVTVPGETRPGRSPGGFTVNAQMPAARSHGQEAAGTFTDSLGTVGKLWVSVFPERFSYRNTKAERQAARGSRLSRWDTRAQRSQAGVPACPCLAAAQSPRVPPTESRTPAPSTTCSRSTSPAPWRRSASRTSARTGGSPGR